MGVSSSMFIYEGGLLFGVWCLSLAFGIWWLKWWRENWKEGERRRVDIGVGKKGREWGYDCAMRGG